MPPLKYSWRVLALSSKVDQLNDALSRANSILVVTHLHPDGDAIGSSLALAEGLEQIGKTVEVCCADPVPENLRFLKGWERIIVARDFYPTQDSPDPVLPQFFQSPDLAIMTDLSAPKRLANSQRLVEKAKSLAIIDHHEMGEDVPLGIWVIEPNQPATAMLLYDIFPKMGIKINQSMAQALLTGIATDTGCFRFPNTNSESLHAAAELVKLGANLSQINEEIWEKRPLPAAKLLTKALTNAKLTCEGKVAISFLTLDDFQETGALDEHSEGIVNEIGRVETVRVFALLREPKRGKVRVNVRSRGEIDVAAVCRLFGGGGHKLAAGCTFESDIESAMNTLLPELEKAALEEN